MALLIGNKHYLREGLKLNTPENDTQDMAGILLSAGFKVVSLVNLDKAEMEMVCMCECVEMVCMCECVEMCVKCICYF